MPRRQHAPRIHYLSTDYLDNSITLAVDGIRYEYFLANPLVVENAEYMLKHWPAKGLNAIKNRAVRTEKLG